MLQRCNVFQHNGRLRIYKTNIVDMNFRNITDQMASDALIILFILVNYSIKVTM